MSKKFNPGDLVMWYDSVDKKYVVNLVVSLEEAMESQGKRTVTNIESTEEDAIWLKDLDGPDIGWMPEHTLLPYNKATAILFVKDEI